MKRGVYPWIRWSSRFALVGTVLTVAAAVCLAEGPPQVSGFCIIWRSPAWMPFRFDWNTPVISVLASNIQSITYFNPAVYRFLAALPWRAPAGPYRAADSSVVFDAATIAALNSLAPASAADALKPNAPNPDYTRPVQTYDQYLARHGRR